MAAIAAAPVMAQVMAGVSAVSSLADGYFESQSLRRQGKAALADAEANAQLAIENAAQARSKGEADARTRRIEGLQDVGRMRTMFGASGVDFTGSPLDVLQYDAQIAETDALWITHQADLQAKAFEREAAIQRERGAIARSQAKKGARAALLMGGVRAVGGAGSVLLRNG